MHTESDKHIILQYVEDAVGVRAVQVEMRNASLSFNSESACFRVDGYLSAGMPNPVTYIIPSSRIITIQMEAEYVVEETAGEQEN